MDDSKLAYTVEEAAKALSISPWLVREEMGPEAHQVRQNWPPSRDTAVVARGTAEPTDSERDLPVEVK